MRLFIVIFIIIIIFFSNCSHIIYSTKVESGIEVKDEVLAEINTEKILIKDFKDLMKILSIKKFSDYENKSKFLNNLISYRLVVQDAKKKKIEQSSEFQIKLKLLRDELLISEIQDKIIDEAKKVSDSELYNYYLKNINKFTTPRLYHLLHIKVRTKKEIDEIIEKLKNGEEFEKVAEKYSIAESKKRGGDIGFVDIEKLEPVFENAILLLKENEVSPVIYNNDEYNIFKLIEIRKEQVISYEQVKDDIRNEYILQKAKNNWNKYLENLKKKAKIKINEEILKEIE
ncbi:MAG TPA: peptidyl-prolyl cis-trans isomerase [bacterium]|nr:peptidyl-prolyl cis-trans isomerase [bacterium]HPQ19084.1 peptidyl-prolyl cis-trans isomerase [bacterium]